MPDATDPRPNLNTYWVIPGKFLAGEYPGDKDLGQAREKISRFLEVGIRHFIDLTEYGEYDLVPYEAILLENPGQRIFRRLTSGTRSEISACRAMPSIWLRFSSRSIVGSGKEVLFLCTVGEELVAPASW